VAHQNYGGDAGIGTCSCLVHRCDTLFKCPCFAGKPAFGGIPGTSRSATLAAVDWMFADTQSDAEETTIVQFRFLVYLYNYKLAQLVF
jgi:hypothetical protein